MLKCKNCKKVSGTGTYCIYHERHVSPEGYCSDYEDDIS